MYEEPKHDLDPALIEDDERAWDPRLLMFASRVRHLMRQSNVKLRFDQSILYWALVERPARIERQAGEDFPGRWKLTQIGTGLVPLYLREWRPESPARFEKTRLRPYRDSTLSDMYAQLAAIANVVRPPAEFEKVEPSSSPELSDPNLIPKYQVALFFGRLCECVKDVNANVAVWLDDLNAMLARVRRDLQDSLGISFDADDAHSSDQLDVAASPESPDPESAAEEPTAPMSEDAGKAENPESESTKTANVAEVSDKATFSALGLAEEFDVPYDPLRKRLERFRKTTFKGWHEDSERETREPQYLYKVGAVRRIIEDLQASTETSTEGPSKKKDRR